MKALKHLWENVNRLGPTVKRLQQMSLRGGIVSTQAIIEKCQNLYDDLDFTAVKEWKKKTGGKVIGFLPVYIPREIIHAAGALPVGIMGGGANLEIIKGDAYFQSYICHIPRSTIELGVTGRLDEFDGMIFPAICDVIRNLSGMWQMLFPEKYVKYLDLPQNFDQAIGGQFYKHEMQSIVDELQRLTGNDITPAALNRSIALYNENRVAIEKLYDMRAENPQQVPTSELYLLLRASNVMEVSEHTAMLNAYADVVVGEERPLMDNVRVVVNGAFCEQPPLALIKGIEASGCYIVDDDWVLGTRFIIEGIPETDDPLDALACAYLSHTVASSSKYIGDEEKGRFLLQTVRERKAEGVIFAAPSFCDPALLDRPMLVDALVREAVPYTCFKYAENTGQFNVFKEQTGTFSDSIKLWGEA